MEGHRNLPVHACSGSHGGAPLAEAMGGEKPLPQAMEDWEILVQYMGDLEPLLWA